MMLVSSGILSSSVMISNMSICTLLEDTEIFWTRWWTASIVYRWL